jgi:hypothetical protein
VHRVGLHDLERHLARAHFPQVVAQTAEHERGAELLRAKLLHGIVQMLHRHARNDERHDQHEGDDGEAEGEPRAQGHVQCR